MTEPARDVEKLVHGLARKYLEVPTWPYERNGFARELLLWAAQELRNSQKQIKDGSIAHLFDLNQHECAAVLEAKAGELK